MKWQILERSTRRPYAVFATVGMPSRPFIENCVKFATALRVHSLCDATMVDSPKSVSLAIRVEALRERVERLERELASLLAELETRTVAVDTAVDEMHRYVDYSVEKYQEQSIATAARIERKLDQFIDRLQRRAKDGESA